ncbi:MAG: DUF711 family protein [Anaerolineae bacterium]
MKIRSITLFAKLEVPVNMRHIEQLGEAARIAAETFTSEGYEVQTVRLATSLFPALLRYGGRTEAVALIGDLESSCQSAGFEYLSLGSAWPGTRGWLPDILKATNGVFATTHIVEPGSGNIDGASIRECAAIIRRAAEIEDGFGNLRFAALANVKPGTPFFPAAYWLGDEPAFAIATQSADLALSACRGARDAAHACKRFSALVQSHAGNIQRIGEAVGQAQGLRFGGIDFSPAPFPDPDVSIGAALETLAGGMLGDAGTLAAAAALTHAVQSVAFAQTGFCGLMMPVLEDNILAQRAAEGRLHIHDLLVWSAVCGTGLDTVPLPGDVSEEALSALLFDVAALSVRLNKPLTARLMPLPGKKAGDPVHFDFPYFADGGVLDLSATSASGKLVDTQLLPLEAYNHA